MNTPSWRNFVANQIFLYSAVSNFGYMDMPNTKTDPGCVIARSAATRQSMRRFSLRNAGAIRKAVWIAAGLRSSQ
jgi:hypothetical protein